MNVFILFLFQGQFDEDLLQFLITIVDDELLEAVMLKYKQTSSHYTITQLILLYDRYLARKGINPVYKFVDIYYYFIYPVQTSSHYTIIQLILLYDRYLGRKGTNPVYKLVDIYYYFIYPVSYHVLYIISYSLNRQVTNPVR